MNKTLTKSITLLPLEQDILLKALEEYILKKKDKELYLQAHNASALYKRIKDAD